MPGSGKTEAAIRYINQHPEKHYLFVTPYLTETERIIKCCPEAHFSTPEPRYNNHCGKLESLHELLTIGANISTTHALLGYYNEDTIALLQGYEYVLFLDEVYDVVEKMKVSKPDLALLQGAGAITIEDGRVEWHDHPEYIGTRYDDLMGKAKSRTLFMIHDTMMYWLFPTEVFKAFSKAFILTYMFDGQVQKYYFDLMGIDYEYIGVEETGDGFRFCDTPCNNAKYSALNTKIHILLDPKLNSIGDSNTALSSTWYKRRRGRAKNSDTEFLRKTINNVYRNRYESSASEFMWTCFKDDRARLTGKGYTKGFVSCNARATNAYRTKHHLAYCINTFLDPNVKGYLIENGVDVDEDAYALSELIQWLFRSAIRDGEDIYIYVPSSRMRHLLIRWLAALSLSGGECE